MLFGYQRNISSNMVSEKLDVVVFGATGFTGKYIVREFIKIGHKKYSWGIAGRNHQKLKELLDSVTTKTGEDVTTVPIILADCDNQKSLNDMAKQAKVVINCCGPYRFYGECVVKACVENGASHVDVSGEPEYMEKMQLLYNDAAEEKGVYIVSACGMDSVPVDLGVVFLYNNFNGILNTVESYMEISSTNKKYEPICNYATWESAVHGFTNQLNLVDIRKQLNAKFKRPRLQPRLPQRSNIHRSDLFENKQCVPFPGSDRSVVNRSQILLNHFNNQRPVQFNPFLVCANWLVLLAVMSIGYFLQIFTKYEYGRQLLLKYPEFFTLGMMSRKGVPEDAAIRTTLVIRFRGEGWTTGTDLNTPPNKTVMAEFSAQNPAYGFTSASVILCALTLITETSKIPGKGGVLTPGSAFAKTSLIENLCKYGSTFKIIGEKTK